MGQPLQVLTQESGIPLLRTSERNDFKKCPWLWHQSWNRGLTTRRSPTWSWFGTAWHKGQEAWYIPGRKRGGLLNAINAFETALDGEVRRVYSEGLEIDEVDIVDGRELGIAMIRGYVDHYGKEPEWEVIHTEQPFQIDVTDPDTGDTIVTYAGTWDALMWNRHSKTWWVWDHKTRKSFPQESRWGFYNINDQAGSYLWVAPEILRHLGVFGKKDVLEGLVFNTARKAMPDTRPRNRDGLATNKPQKEDYEAAFAASGLHFPPRTTIAGLEELAQAARITVYGKPSAVQPKELFHREEIYRSPAERVTQATRVIAEAKAMAAMRNGTLDLWKTPSEDCLRCQFFDFCEIDEASHEEGELYARTVMTRRDPYRDHREDFALKGVSLVAPGKGKPKKKGK